MLVLFRWQNFDERRTLCCTRQFVEMKSPLYCSILKLNNSQANNAFDIAFDADEQLATSWLTHMNYYLE